MSPRKPAGLHDGDGHDLREHLIVTAARLIAERGSAGLSVRDIARAAKVADGVLYNYFEDKDDLLAHALLAHVGAVMGSAPVAPPPGAATVADNLREFIDNGLELLSRVAPAFAGLLSQPGALTRFHQMVGGSAAFGVSEGASGQRRPAAREADVGPEAGVGLEAARATEGLVEADRPDTDEAPSAGEVPAAAGGHGLPDLLTDYLAAEQRLGRVDAGADIDAAAMLIIGAIHGQILPRVLFTPPGTPSTWDQGLAGRLAETVLAGIAPGPRPPSPTAPNRH